MLTIHNFICSQLYHTVNRDLRWRKTAAERETWQVYCFGKKMSWCLTEGVQRGFLSERKGKVIYCRGAEDRKGAGTNSEESGTRHLEAESIRSRSESTGGCVNLKPVSVRGIKSDSGCHGLRVEWFPNTLRPSFFLAGNWQQIWNKNDY